MTVLVGMHLGTHTIVISDRRSSILGCFNNDSTEKLQVAKNHAVVMGGSHYLGFAGLVYLRDKDFNQADDLLAFSEIVLEAARNPIEGGVITQERTVFMVASTADEKAKLFFLELNDLPRGGQVKEQRELLPGEFELGIPAGLSEEEGQDLRDRVQSILEAFMKSKGNALNPGNTKGLTELFLSVGRVLATLAETTPSISSMFDVAIKSSSGLTIQGEINFGKRRILNLNQRLEKRWVYEVDGYAP